MTGADPGRYRLGARLGGGGVGTVFRALDTATGEAVALKRFASSGDAAAVLARLRREISISRAIGEDGLVGHRGCGLWTDGGPFLVMTLIDGPSLDRHLPPDGMPVAQALDIVIAIAGTLDALHRLGVIHRDVKPGNILLPPGRPAILADLGAAALDPADLHGDLIGAPGFMAPETILDQPVDGRADVFALGVTLYRLLTGRRPFIGTASEVMAAITAGSPPVLAGLPTALATLVADTLARDPLLRPTAGELMQKAQEIRQGGRGPP